MKPQSAGQGIYFGAPSRTRTDTGRILSPTTWAFATVGQIMNNHEPTAHTVGSCRTKLVKSGNPAVPVAVQDA
jgi:hypothetical protein